MESGVSVEYCFGKGVMQEERRRVMSGAAVFLCRGDKLI